MIRKGEALFFHNRKDYTYINSKGKFYNGYILTVKDDFLIFKDDVIGEKPFYFADIDIIEKSKKKNPNPTGDHGG